MLDLLINGVSYINNLKANTLDVTRKIEDTEGEFSLLLSPDQVHNVDVGADVKVTTSTETASAVTISGGVINEIEYKKYMNLVQLNIKYEGYTRALTTKKMITMPQPSDPTIANMADAIVRQILTQYLSVENVQEGFIQSNIAVDDSVWLEDTTVETIAQKLDTIAKNTNSAWYIDNDRFLYFYQGVKNFVEYTTAIEWNSPDFRDVKVTREITDYRNQQKITGGEPTEAVGGQYIDNDGNLYVVQDDTTEQARMQTMSGGDGIYMNAETNSAITTLAEIQKYANDLLSKYGKPPVNVEFTTTENKYNPGDFIYLDIPMFNLNNAKFVIEEIEIKDNSRENQVFDYTIKANMRNTNDKRANFYDFLSQLNKKNNSTDKNKSLYAETVGVNIQNAVQTSVSVTTS